ncbi:MAG TPA: hypothetical protein VN943_00785 [Candidatus Acidoferrum sp.]|nr:hypothetical protein [Candidatus Acidoferrum sp.]
MWIIKGVLLGLGVFLVGSIVYVVGKLRPLEADKATSVNLLLSLTASNLWFWVAFAAAVIAGCAVVRYLATAKAG